MCDFLRYLQRFSIAASMLLTRRFSDAGAPFVSLCLMMGLYHLSISLIRCTAGSFATRILPALTVRYASPFLFRMQNCWNSDIPRSVPKLAMALANSTPVLACFPLS